MKEKREPFCAVAGQGCQALPEIIRCAAHMLTPYLSTHPTPPKKWKLLTNVRCGLEYLLDLATLICYWKDAVSLFFFSPGQTSAVAGLHRVHVGDDLQDQEGGEKVSMAV